MRWRLLSSFAIALLWMAGVVATAATLVSALEGDSSGEPGAFAAEQIGTSSLERFDCDGLRREIHALSHEVTRCSTSDDCRGSPLLCPMALDPRIEREYERLREALHARCGLPRKLLDFAWVAGEQVDLGEDCALVHDGFEAAVRGEATPTSYSF